VARGKRSWGSIRRFPSGRYQARYLDPDTHRFAPAPQTFASKGAADRWLNRKRAELDAGTAIDEKAGLKPLSDWWPGYWRSVQSRKPTTRVNYSTAWRLRIEPRFGSMPVRRIKPSHIEGDRRHEQRRLGTRCFHRIRARSGPAACPSDRRQCVRCSPLPRLNGWPQR
jgi:Phage integrase, N-terminal SAM-like domain